MPSVALSGYLYVSSDMLGHIFRHRLRVTSIKNYKINHIEAVLSYEIGLMKIKKQKGDFLLTKIKDVY